MDYPQLESSLAVRAFQLLKFEHLGIVNTEEAFWILKALAGICAFSRSPGAARRLGSAPHASCEGLEGLRHLRFMGRGLPFVRKVRDE